MKTFKLSEMSETPRKTAFRMYCMCGKKISLETCRRLAENSPFSWMREHYANTAKILEKYYFDFDPKIFKNDTI